LRAETIAKAAGRKLKDKSVIFVWLPGGMSQLESYDMKPNAPVEYRGVLNPIRTNVPGTHICELFPSRRRSRTSSTSSAACITSSLTTAAGTSAS
jgi:hypothetical protein